MSYCPCLVLVLVLGLVEVSGSPPGSTTVFVAHQRDPQGVKYSCFRAPALRQTPNGTLIAFAEAGRPNAAVNDDCDAGNVHIVLRRSKDEGKTWSKILSVTQHEDGHYTGGASPIVDQHTGSIHLQYDRDNNEAFYVRSDDEGLTWTVPLNLSSMIIPQNGTTWYAPGPSGGLQSANGTLITATETCSGSECIVTAIRSTDGGASWGVSEPLPLVGQEPSIASRPDGRIIALTRSSTADVFNLAVSVDAGARTWKAMAPPALPNLTRIPDCSVS
jgi:sialidase-1